MTADAGPVNGSLLNQTPKSYLTLSAVGEVDEDRDGSLTVPAEAAVRDERDPLTPSLLRERGWTDPELRWAWGDR